MAILDILTLFTWCMSLTLVIGLMKKMKPLLFSVAKCGNSCVAVLEKAFKIYGECLRNVALIEFITAVFAVLFCALRSIQNSKIAVLFGCLGIAFLPVTVLTIVVFKSFVKTFGFDGLEGAKTLPVVYGLTFGVCHTVIMIAFLYALCVSFALI